MTTNLTPQQVLLAAADLMEKCGKATGQYVDEQGRVCALGAIGRSLLFSCCDGEDTIRFRSAVDDLLRKHIGEELLITEWSDASDAATVIATLRKAGGA